MKFCMLLFLSLTAIASPVFGDEIYVQSIRQLTSEINVAIDRGHDYLVLRLTDGARSSFDDSVAPSVLFWYHLNDRKLGLVDVEGVGRFYYGSNGDLVCYQNYNPYVVASFSKSDVQIIYGKSTTELIYLRSVNDEGEKSEIEYRNGPPEELQQKADANRKLGVYYREMFMKISDMLKQK